MVNRILAKLILTQAIGTGYITTFKKIRQLLISILWDIYICILYTKEK